MNEIHIKIIPKHLQPLIVSLFQKTSPHKEIKTKQNLKYINKILEYVLILTHINYMVQQLRNGYMSQNKKKWNCRNSLSVNQNFSAMLYYKTRKDVLARTHAEQ